MSILDLLFPKRCVGCKRLGSYICENCFAHISFDTSSICLVCGRPSIDGLTHPRCKSKFAVDGSFCGINYKGVVKKLVYSFKYKPYVIDLKSTLVDLLFESLIQKELFVKALEFKPILVPIPLTLKRLKSRGYNQAEILAMGLSEKFSLPVMNILERTRETKPQFGLKREERIKNMSGVFGVNNLTIKQFSNSTIQSAFLVDDILTTGTTLFEAAKVLKRNGFTKVWGLSLTRDQ